MPQAFCKNLKCFFMFLVLKSCICFFYLIYYCFYQLCISDIELKEILENYLQLPPAGIHWHFRQRSLHCVRWSCALQDVFQPRLQLVNASKSQFIVTNKNAAWGSVSPWARTHQLPHHPHAHTHTYTQF